MAGTAVEIVEETVVDVAADGVAAAMADAAGMAVAVVGMAVGKDTAAGDTSWASYRFTPIKAGPQRAQGDHRGTLTRRDSVPSVRLPQARFIDPSPKERGSG